MIGIHPTTIAQSFQNAATKAVEFLEGMSTPVDLNDREALLRAAGTSLNSKVSYSRFMIPVADDRSYPNIPPHSPLLPSQRSLDSSPQPLQMLI
jgi:hypothetical protein